MSGYCEINIAADMEQLEAALSPIREMLEGIEADPAISMKIEVCAEEIFTNIASYAYKDSEKAGQVCIKCYASSDPKSIKITFEDAGIEYNPLARPDPDITASVEERKIGGLGVYMTKKFMDKCSYNYENGKNIFTIYKELEG